jgi:hypothetical protein
MALQSSGQISLNDIATEIGLSPPFSLRSMSSTAGFSSPDTISDFYGYSAGPVLAPSYYFVVANRVSRAGRWTRDRIDVNSYDLYQKPDDTYSSVGNYTLLTSYNGDQYTTREGNQLTSQSRLHLTSITATGLSGAYTYEVGTNTKGDAYYINLIQPYL